MDYGVLTIPKFRGYLLIMFVLFLGAQRTGEQMRYIPCR